MIAEFLQVILSLNSGPWAVGARHAVEAIVNLGTQTTTVAGRIIDRFASVTQTLALAIPRAARDTIAAFAQVAVRGVAAGNAIINGLSTVATSGFKILSQMPLLGLEKGFAAAAQILPALTNVITTTLMGITNSLAAVAVGVSRMVVTTISMAFTTVRNVIGSVVTGVTSTLVNIASVAVASFGGFGLAVTSLGSLIGGVFTSAFGVVSTFASGVATTLGSLAKTVMAVADVIVQSMKEIMTSVKDLLVVVLQITTEVAQTISKLGADFVEEANKFNAAFRGFAGEANQFVLTFGAAVGRSQLQLVKFTSEFQSILYTLGFTREESKNMSLALTKLAVDLASFFNVADEKALRALESGIIGNHRALRQFGIGINQATLEMELHRTGIEKAFDQYTDFEKAQARFNIIMRQTTDMQGDAERTANSFANTIKRLQAVVEDLGVEFGLKLNTSIAATIEEFGGFDSVRTILSVVFAATVEITSEITRLGLMAAKTVADWVTSMGGVETVNLRIKQGMAAIKVVFFELLLGAKGFGVGLVAVVEVGVAAFNLLWAHIKRGFADVKQVFGGFMQDIASGLADIFDYFPGSDKMVTSLNKLSQTFAVMEAEGGLDEYFHRIVSIPNALDVLNERVADTGSVFREIFGAMTGEADFLQVKFQEVGGNLQRAFDALNFNATVESMEWAKSKFYEFGAAAEAVIGRVMQKQKDLLNSLNIPAPGPDREQSGGPYNPGTTIPYQHPSLPPLPDNYYQYPGYGSGGNYQSNGQPYSGQNVFTGSGYGGSYSSGYGDGYNWSNGGYNWNQGGYNWSQGGYNYQNRGEAIPRQAGEGSGYNYYGEGYADGGLVSGPGGRDRVPARLTAGEYVVNADAARTHRTALNAMNNGGAPAPKSQPSKKTVIIHQTISPSFPGITKLDDETIERKLLPAMRRLMRQNGSGRK